MQPLLCALAGLALLGVEAGEWGQGPRDTPGRRGRNRRQRYRESWREGKVMVTENRNTGTEKGRVKGER